MPRFLRAVIRAPGLRDKRAAPGVFFAAMLLLSLPAAAGAQSPGEVFRKVTPSVVVIRAKGSEVTAAGQVRFLETGPGVLIAADGKVRAAAHVVHSMNEISGGLTTWAAVMTLPSAEIRTPE